jgi:hypothetical protein
MTSFSSSPIIDEMKEFATLSGGDQRYIRRSLDVAASGAQANVRWARDAGEEASILAQARVYRLLLPAIRSSIPDDLAIDEVAEIFGPMITLTAFDLGQGKLASFAAYRFLYERLLGGAVRPWLPSAFVAAAALPSLHPVQRKALLGTVTNGDAAAPGWSIRDPEFYPEWVEKDTLTIA